MVGGFNKMKIMDKVVIRAEIQTWIGKGDISAKHFHGYLTNTEKLEEHQTMLEYFTQKDAAIGCVALFMEFYNLKEYVLIFCSRAALCTI
jgi:hypothetical protein